MRQGSFLNIYFEPQVIKFTKLGQLIGINIDNNFITDYIKIPEFYFLERVNKGQIKTVNVNY